MKVLIAGGAGYICSTIASACSVAGVSPVILDSLVTGRCEFAAGRDFYLGTGAGTTVRELLDAFNRVADRPVRARDAERRPGDTAGAYTRIDRAERLLSWRPQYDVAEGIGHSLQWAAIRDEVLPDEAAQPSL